MPTDLDRARARTCQVCNGSVETTMGWVRSRQTRGLICPRCGWDYGKWGEP